MAPLVNSRGALLDPDRSDQIIRQNTRLPSQAIRGRTLESRGATSMAVSGGSEQQISMRYVVVLQDRFVVLGKIQQVTKAAQRRMLSWLLAFNFSLLGN